MLGAKSKRSGRGLKGELLVHALSYVRHEMNCDVFLAGNLFRNRRKRREAERCRRLTGVKSRERAAGDPSSLATEALPTTSVLLASITVNSRIQVNPQVLKRDSGLCSAYLFTVSQSLPSLQQPRYTACPGRILDYTTTNTSEATDRFAGELQCLFRLK